MGHRQRAARLAGGGARRLPRRSAPDPPHATSSPSPRPARARPRSPCGSPPSCSSGAWCDAVTVVAPTEHLKHQWADAAGRVGITLDPAFRNAQGAVSRDYAGVAVTYAQVAAHPMLHRRAPRPAHAGDPRRDPPRRRRAVLGRGRPRGVRARDPAARADRHARSAPTPRRSRSCAYAEGRDGVRRSRGRLLLRLRPRAARRRRPPGDLPGLLRADALAHQGRRRDERHARRAADQGRSPRRPGGPRSTRRATGSRRCSPPPTGGSPRSGAASPTPAAWSSPPTSSPPAPTPPSCAASPARRRRSCSPTRPAPARGSRSSPTPSDRWMVAVRMVSEGVDVPRLAVGVYATSTSTPLFFAQAVGRFVRARRRGETASVFLPSVPLLLAARRRDGGRARPRAGPAGRRTTSRRPVRCGGRPAGRRDPDPRRAGARRRRAFEALEAEARSTGCSSTAASSAARRRSGPRRSRTSSACPGLLEPDQVATLLRARQSAQVGRGGRGGRRPAPRTGRPPRHRAIPALRKELNGLVGAWHHRTGRPARRRARRAAADVRRAAGGAGRARTQLQARIDLIRSWALRRR